MPQTSHYTYASSPNDAKRFLFSYNYMFEKKTDVVHSTRLIRETQLVEQNDDSDYN